MNINSDTTLNKKIAKLALPLFVLWPFGGFLAALFKFRSGTGAFIYIAFTTLFGFAFDFSDPSADSHQVAWLFTTYKGVTVSEIFSLYKQGILTDFYRFLAYGVTHMFTTNPKVLFAIFGLVFGVFSYLSIALIVREKKGLNDLYLFLMLLAFFSLAPITTINGARFYTALWLFFYSASSFLFYRKRAWIIGVLVTPMVHFSFVFGVVVVVLFFLLGKLFYSGKDVRGWLFYAFIATFFISFTLETNAIKLDFLLDRFFPPSIEGKIALYNGEEIVRTMEERGTSLFHQVTRIMGYFMKVYFFVLLLTMRKRLRLVTGNDSHQRLLAFVFFFLTLTFLISSVPSGARFLSVGYLFAILLFVRVYRSTPDPKLQKLALWSVPVFAYQILFTIGYFGYMFVSHTVYYGNLFWVIYEGIGYQFTL